MPSQVFRQNCKRKENSFLLIIQNFKRKKLDGWKNRYKANWNHELYSMVLSGMNRKWIELLSGFNKFNHRMDKDFDQHFVKWPANYHHYICRCIYIYARAPLCPFIGPFGLVPESHIEWRKNWTVEKQSKALTTRNHKETINQHGIEFIPTLCVFDLNWLQRKAVSFPPHCSCLCHIVNSEPGICMMVA